jgi:hypothetical protein
MLTLRLGLGLRCASVAVLALGGCSATPSGLPPDADLSWDSVAVCGHTVGPFFAESLEGDDRYWDGSDQLTCDGNGNCFGDLDSFDLRPIGYRAFGATRIWAELRGRVVVSARPVCTGADCEVVLAGLSGAACEEVASGLGPLGIEQVLAQCGPGDDGVDAWTYSIAVRGQNSGALLSIDRVGDEAGSEQHDLAGSSVMLSVDLPIVDEADQLPSESTAFPCEAESLLIWRYELFSSAGLAPDCVVLSGDETTPAAVYGDPAPDGTYNGCRNAFGP